MKCTKCRKLKRRPGQPWCLRCHREYMKKWRKTHPLTLEQKKRSNARSYLKVYLKRGKVKKKPCEICGALDVQAHHRDYSKPLDVRWLCKKHHLRIAKKTTK